MKYLEVDNSIWAVLHEIRSDYAQLLTCTLLALIGPGVASLDEMLAKRKRYDKLAV